MNPAKRRALERRRERLKESIEYAKQRLAEVDRRTDLTERGRKQQRTLWANRVRQLEMELERVNQRLAGTYSWEKDLWG